MTIGLVLLLSTAAARADDKTGSGISATLGASMTEDKDPGGTFNGNGFGLAGDIEYRFTPHFALGFGLYSLDQAEDTVNSVDTAITVRGLDVFGRVILPVSGTAAETKQAACRWWASTTCFEFRSLSPTACRAPC